MTHIQFKLTTNVDGTIYEDGAIVPTSQIPAGSLKSLLYTRQAVKCDAPQAKVEAPAPPPAIAEPVAHAATTPQKTKPKADK